MKIKNTTFSQLQLIETLRKQLSQADYEAIKKKLRIKREPSELLIFTASKLIEEMIKRIRLLKDLNDLNSKTEFELEMDDLLKRFKRNLRSGGDLVD